MKKIQIVLGTFFGDEGKGATVQWLSTHETLVVRFSGGPQCGHRVIYNNTEHVCSLVGSGILKGAATYLHKDVYVDPISLYNELQTLIAKGINPTIYIHPDCRVITPYDIMSDRNNSKVKSDGSCGCGIYATFMRSRNFPITIADALTDPQYTLRHFLHRDDVIDDDFIKACNKLDGMITLEKNTWRRYEHIVFEGSQGLLLDMDNGFMPHCTPSRVGLNGIPEGMLEDAEVFLVMRSYLTRHGNGFEPRGENVIRKSYHNLHEPTNLDDGPQGKFKIGCLDPNLFNAVVMRSHLDNYQRMFNVTYNLVVTHMDCSITPNSVLLYDKGIINHTALRNAFLSDDIKISKIYAGYSPTSDIKQVHSYVESI